MRRNRSSISECNPIHRSYICKKRLPILLSAIFFSFIVMNVTVFCGQLLSEPNLAFTFENKSLHDLTFVTDSHRLYQHLLNVFQENYNGWLIHYQSQIILGIALLCIIVFPLLAWKFLHRQSNNISTTSYDNTSNNLAALIENMQMGVLFEDNSRRVVLANQTFCKLFNISASVKGLIGTDSRQITKSTMPLMIDQEDYVRQIEENVRECKVVANEKLLLKDGRIFERDYVPINIDKKRLGYLWQFRDVTQRERSAEKLVEEKNKSEAIIAAMGDGLSIQDRQFRILYQNDLHKGFIGDHKGELCYQAYESQKDVCEACPLRLSFQDGKIHNADRTIYPNGKARHFEIVSSPLRDAKGNIIAGIEYVREITERKISEERLKERERQLAESQRIAHIGSWERDIVTDHVSWSDEMFRLLGLEPQESEANFQSLIDMIHPDDREGFKNTIKKALDEKSIYDNEFRIIKKDRSEAIIYARGEAIYDESGNPKILKGTAQDITESKNAEKTLIKLNKAVEASGEAIFMTDVNGIISYINPEFTRLYGYEPNEILGKVTPRILKSGVLNAEHYQQFWKSLLNKENLRGEMINKTKSGNIIHIDSSANPILDQNGNITGFLAIQRDITERKKSEEALRESEEKFRSIAEQLSDLIALTDATGYILYVSPASNRLFQRNPKEMVGVHFTSFLDESEIPIAVSVFQDAVSNRKNTVNLELKMKRKDGSIFIGELNGALHQSNLNAGTLVTIRDISERKHAEEERKLNISLLRATFESTADGILVVDQSGAITDFNQKFTQLWRIPDSVIASKDDKQAIDFVLDQLTDPDGFVSKVQELYNNPYAESFDKLEFKDGRCFERYSRPQMLGGKPVGRVWSFRDITQRRQVEERNVLLVQTIKSVTDCISITDMENNILYVNDAFLKTYGYSETDLLGKNISCVVPDEYLVNKMSDILTSTLSGGWHGELINKRKDGTKFPIELWTTVVNDAIGNPMACVGIARDISEKIRAEESLRESENKFRSLFEQSTDAMLLLDGKIFFDCNRAAMVMMGCTTKEQMLFMHPSKLSPEYQPDGKSSAEKADELITLAFQKGSLRFEWLHRKINGEDFPVEVQLTSLPLGGKQILFTVWRDITERKKAEIKIIEQAHLLDITNDAIYVRNMDDKITYWNRGAERVHGYSFTEAINITPKDLIIEEDWHKYDEAKKILLKHGEWEGELFTRKKNGKIIVVQSHWTLVKDKFGNPIARLIINRDITQQREMEAQVRRTQRLESIGVLASGIAHDLNNVLTPILMSVDLLDEKMQDQHLRKYISTISTSAKRGSEIIRQVLSFARGSEEGFALQQLRYIIRDIETIIRETFPKNIKISVTLAKDLKPISGDATQLHQLIMNLCVNAKDAMPMGGELSINAENTIIDQIYARMNPEYHIGEYLLLTISDTGVGIPKELLDKIFEPFFTTKEIGKGTGLGLSTVHTIVKNHNGFIQLQSLLKKGSQFKVFLPVVSGEEQKQVNKFEIKSVHGNNELILVVDDEPVILQITKETLEANGYKVITVPDGTDALATFVSPKSESISLVLTDLNMPGMDGATLVSALQKIDKNVKIILSSGVLTDLDSAKIAALKINDFITKPYTAIKLLTVIQNVLRKK